MVDALLDGPWHVDGAPVHADSALGHPPLITGAVLTTGVEAQALAIACGSAGSTSARTVVELRVSEGPAAGVCRPLPLGDVLVGRGPQCHVQVDDPTLSRTQLRLAVTADRVFVTDLGGPNTTTLDDGPLVPGEPTVVRAGSRLQVGDTVLTLAVAEPGPRSPTPDGQGRLVVTPVLRPRPPIDRSPVPVPAAPDATRASRPPWAALLVPLVMCGVAAWILHSTVLLVLGLVSPAAIFVGWLVDRRHGRRQGAFTRHRHARAIAAADVVVRDRVAAELAARRETHPDLATVWAAAHHRAPGLWCQPAAEPRATEVRLGRADLPALFVTRPVDDAGAQHGSDQHPVLPDAPSSSTSSARRCSSDPQPPHGRWPAPSPPSWPPGVRRAPCSSSCTRRARGPPPGGSCSRSCRTPPERRPGARRPRSGSSSWTSSTGSAAGRRSRTTPASRAPSCSGWRATSQGCPLASTSSSCSTTRVVPSSSAGARTAPSGCFSGPTSPHPAGSTGCCEPWSRSPSPTPRPSGVVYRRR
ncbi:FHA domain-containing protein [Arsenicicoccus piscis]|uniref:FHA domain-containing protein n=1 Tax=Arsenicicoccus piscis TaxID=673954 RepID=UPI003D6685FF